jgi:hypothetical protein
MKNKMDVIVKLCDFFNEYVIDVKPTQLFAKLYNLVKNIYHPSVDKLQIRDKPLLEDMIVVIGLNVLNENYFKNPNYGINKLCEYLKEFVSNN